MDSAIVAPDPLAWTESMRGPRWKALVEKEQATWKQVTQDLPLALAQTQIEAAGAPYHAPLFQAAKGRVQISFSGTYSYHWQLPNGQEHQAADLDCRSGDWVWAVRDIGKGRENYCLECWHKTKVIWRVESIAPCVAVVGDRVFVLEAKHSLVYYRLVSYSAKSGKDRKVIYEEKDFRYNLELLRGSDSFCWLRRQAGTKQDVLQISEGGKGTVLEGISLEPRRFLLGSRPGEALVWTSEKGWTATPAVRVRLPHLGEKATPEAYDSKRGLLVTKWHGRRTLWKLSTTTAPFTLWSGLGTIMIDPWDGPWVRIAPVGCGCIWWNSESEKRPVENYTVCREVNHSFVKSADGTKVSYVLVRTLANTKPVGLLVVGYGAYGIPLPMMTARWEPLLSAGWAIAFGLWRGGGDHTPEWEDAGRLGGRVRVLEDAEAVVRGAQAETKLPASRTVLYGRSAGGLWVGGLAAKFPDGRLAGGVYSEVGYLDAFRTIQNRSLPLTDIETDEFGLPEMRIADGRVALEWSPMDLVGPKGTPGVWQLVRTAANDQEVLAYESVKWVLRCRAGRSADASRIYLAIPGGQGHFVDHPVRQQAEDACLVMKLAGAL